MMNKWRETEGKGFPFLDLLWESVSVANKAACSLSTRFGWSSSMLLVNKLKQDMSLIYITNHDNILIKFKYYIQRSKHGFFFIL